MICQSTVVERMRESTRVMLMHGASRVLALYDYAAAARGCDGVVCTPDAAGDPSVLLTEDERWKRVEVIPSGTGVFA